MAVRNDLWPPRPFRERGSKLGFVDELEREGKWPLEPPGIDPDHPPATPYLVIPFYASDTGARPLANPFARSGGVEVIDRAVGLPTHQPIVTVGRTYVLRATIWNLGATASYAGLADFYLQPRPSGNTAQAIATFGLASGPRSQGRTGFSVRAGSSIVVESPNTWTPANKLESEFRVIAQAYDLLLDPLGLPFDWVGNRHVARW